jgi:FMN phosphatase YigB (HAD superfamily)
MPGSVLCIDFGGVLCSHGDELGRRHWEAELGLQRGALARLVFGTVAASDALLGAACEDLVWAEVQGLLGLSGSEIARLKVDFWDSHTLSRPLLSMCESIRRTSRVVLVSNFWAGARAKVESLCGLDLRSFDQVFFSCELGVRKPFKEFWSVVVRNLGVESHECVLVDDEYVNVSAAAEYGMISIHHRNDQETIECVERAMR